MNCTVYHFVIGCTNTYKGYTLFIGFLVDISYTNQILWLWNYIFLALFSGILKAITLTLLWFYFIFSLYVFLYLIKIWCIFATCPLGNLGAILVKHFNLFHLFNIWFLCFVYYGRINVLRYKFYLLCLCFVLLRKS